MNMNVTGGLAEGGWHVRHPRSAHVEADGPLGCPGSVDELALAMELAETNAALRRACARLEAAEGAARGGARRPPAAGPPRARLRRDGGHERGRWADVLAPDRARRRRPTRRCCSSARPAPARTSSRAPSTSAAAAASGRSSPSTARRCPRRSSRASCSATRRAPSPARSQRTVGRFEVADGGTLFLDEIGELPLERAGQAAARAAEGRVRAARLGEDDQGGRARDRRHQPRPRGARCARAASAPTSTTASTSSRSRCRRCASAATTSRCSCGTSSTRRQGALGRSIKRVPERLMRAFTAYAWPGNVRELENVVERALIMTHRRHARGRPGLPGHGAGACRWRPRRRPSPTCSEPTSRPCCAECGWKIVRQGQRRRTPRPQPLHAPVPHEEARHRTARKLARPHAGPSAWSGANQARGPL